MIRRVTTNGSMYSYKNTLHRTYGKLYDSSNKVITNRQFSAYAEDPAAASRAFQLRHSRWNVASQRQNNSTVSGKFSQGWDALDEVYDDLGNELGNFSALRGENDPTGAARKELGQSLIATAESIVFTMNSKYGDEYIFSGADGLNAAFSWGKNGELLYRGVNVDTNPNDPDFAATSSVYETGAINVADFPTINPGALVIGGYDVTVDGTLPQKEQLQAWADAYNANTVNPNNDNGEDWTASVNAEGTGIVFTAKKAGAIGGTGPAKPPLDAAVNETTVGEDEDTAAKEAAQEAMDKLKSFLHETTFVDLGMGMEEDENGDIKPATAFNSALCGLKFLGGDSNVQGEDYGGYGLDEDGDPRNFISLIKRVGEILYNCDENTGAWEGSNGMGVEDMERMTKKLQTTLGRVSLTHVDLDTDVAFLKTNEDRLKKLGDTLNEQIVSEEDMDPADAITGLMWAQYSYNAALKIGNGIMSQSLLDYLS